MLILTISKTNLKMRKVMLKTRSLIIKLYKTTILANKSADVKFKHLGTVLSNVVANIVTCVNSTVFDISF